MHIVKLHYCGVEKGNLINIYEFCKDGTLEDKMNAGSIPGDECMNIFFQILKAFEALQEFSVVHRDIKPENILIQDDTYKLADFGLCQKLNENGKATGFAGTLNYIAPRNRDGSGGI